MAASQNFLIHLLPVSTAHQNGTAKFSRGPANQQSDNMYSTPHRQSRPPSAALPKLGSQKAPRTPSHNQHNQRNLDFLNVPDEGMSGWERFPHREQGKREEKEADSKSGWNWLLIKNWWMPSVRAHWGKARRGHSPSPYINHNEK